MNRHVLAAAAALVATSAAANDGAAERAAGGLVFVSNDQVDMVSEELFVSLDQVRVRYVFRNRTPRDVRLTIAILAVVALTASLIDLFGVDPQIGGCMLLFGCLTVVVGAVVLAARRQKAAA